ncbi:MAG TPA: hypothetical protein VGN41_11270 [Streptosporangiaceae bacterium]
MGRPTVAWSATRAPFQNTVASKLTASNRSTIRWPCCAAGTSTVRRYQATSTLSQPAGVSNRS